MLDKNHTFRRLDNSYINPLSHYIILKIVEFKKNLTKIWIPKENFFLQ